MKAGGLMILAAALVGGLGGCTASQSRADAAIKTAQDAMTAQHADAMRFAPEAFRAVMASYDTARTAYDVKDWGAAIAAAERTTEGARQLAPAVAAGKEQAAAAWPAVRDSVQGMLTALGDRLAEVERSRRYPEGLGAGDVAGARAQLDSLSVGLGKAQTAFDAGDLRGALHATDRVRLQAVSLMGTLGLRPRNPHGG